MASLQFEGIVPKEKDIYVLCDKVILLLFYYKTAYEMCLFTFWQMVRLKDFFLFSFYCKWLCCVHQL